jgi:hypothetical protein
MGEKQSYWNTYDPLGMNRIVKFPELFEIRFSVFSPVSRSYASKFYFLEHRKYRDPREFGGIQVAVDLVMDAGNVLFTGPHAPRCEYASVDVSFADSIFRIEYADMMDGKLVCRITPIMVSDPSTLILLEVLRAWNLDGEVELTEKGIEFPCTNGKSVRILAEQDFHSVQYRGTPESRGLYSSEDKLAMDLMSNGTLNSLQGKGKIAVLSFVARLPLRIVAEASTPAHPTLVETQNIDNDLLSARRRHETNSIKIAGSQFEGCAQAVTSVLNWCAVWDQVHERPYTPISRAWIDKIGKTAAAYGFNNLSRSHLLGVWDNLFNALLHSIEDQDLAESNIRAVLDDSSLIDGTYPPNYTTPVIRSGDRSQPPIGSLVVWKLYRKFKNTEFLKWVYPRLKKWHGWWKEKRDGNKDGLLEWGSNLKVKEPGNEAGTLSAAKYESGMDNSPLYDEAEYNRETGTMNMSDVGLNSIYAADAKYLSIIAGELDLQSDSRKFRQEYETIAKKVNEELWNDEETEYLNRYWNGKFSTRTAPTSFYPLMAKIPNWERARRIVEKHLCKEDQFWGEFVIPSISRKDPAFNEQVYWRGRIWPPMNYLVYLGLKEYEMDDLAFEFANKSVRLFMNEWRTEGHSHENYNAITGEGDDAPTPAKPYSEGSDRFYSWGALLALMGIEELIDVEMDEGIRFGCRFLEEQSIISHASLGGSIYRIETSQAETRAFKDDKNFFASKPGTNIRNYVAAEDSVRFRASGNGRTHLTICEFQPNSNLLLTIDGNITETLKSDPNRAISFDAKLNSRYTQFLLEKKPSQRC